MKKIISLFFVLFLISGCYNTKSIVCNSIITEDNYKVESEYIISYQGDYVTKLKTIERVISDDFNLLEKNRKILKEYYNKYNGLDYYVNSLSIEDNTLISSTVINYKKIDIDKLNEIEKNKLIKNGKVTVIDLKNKYIKDNNAVCK